MVAQASACESLFPQPARDLKAATALKLRPFLFLDRRQLARRDPLLFQPTHLFRKAAPLNLFFFRLPIERRMDIEATFVGWLFHFRDQRIRLGESIVSNACNLPRDFHAGGAT